MPLHLHRLAAALTPAALDDQRPPATQTDPECIVLPPVPGQPTSEQPPVRIFLGTERNQFRAERAFVWSVHKHRNPGRRYEIYLMRELAGFRRGYWLTGFTNYRFAIPELAGFVGRAIYNDTDQIYLTDPAELFDQDMNGAGFLSINDRDTSVMLIDCQRMARTWHPGAVRSKHRKELEADARKADLWGPLDGSWNARDSEYDPDTSRLVHFTTLHTQPWRPFPELFVYDRNPTDPLWPDLEAECNAAGFWPFSASSPSSEWAQAAAQFQHRADWPRLQAILAGSSQRQPLDIEGLLDQVPDNDLGWVLEALFASATELRLEVQEPTLARGNRQRRNDWFWQQHLELAASRHPQVRWRFMRRRRGRLQELHGGPAPLGAIAVLTHQKPGHNNNAVALARALGERTGRPVMEVPVPWSERQYVRERLLGRGDLPELGTEVAVLVASGWLPTRVAQQAARRLGPATRLILLGRKAGPPPQHGGLLIQCQHFGLPEHPNRLRTLLPLNAAHASAPHDTSRWQSWLDAPRRVALLVGGDTRAHYLRDPERLARAASQWARDRDARLLVVTSRRTAAALPALRAGLTGDDLLHRWQADDPDNPYGLALQHADALAVTGESESMLADAAGSPSPVWIWPLQAREPDAWQRFTARVAAQASEAQYNARGSIRPQQGLRYICARLIERGWVLPPRNLEAMHEALINAGLVTYFGGPEPAHPQPFVELEPVAETVVSRLGLATGANT